MVRGERENNEKYRDLERRGERSKGGVKGKGKEE